MDKAPREGGIFIESCKDEKDEEGRGEDGGDGQRELEAPGRANGRGIGEEWLDGVGIRFMAAGEQLLNGEDKEGEKEEKVEQGEESALRTG